MRRPLLCACLLVLTLAACQRAARYPSSKAASISSQENKDEPLPIWSWLPVEERPDLPLRFVPESDPEWPRLQEFWNQDPPLAGGMRTMHLGLAPLQAATALAVGAGLDSVKIKVPRGLPDPNPLVPASNPPTFGRWRLGKKIFHEPVLKSSGLDYSCAVCHEPAEGFTNRRAHVGVSPFNTLSLINAAYNRHQFWDGRAVALEETVVAALADEKPGKGSDAAEPEVSHRWGGLVQALGGQPEYVDDFRRVFGIDRPTQDAIAKALATYMRTILSGDSLYDRAEAERRRAGGRRLSAEHFGVALGEDGLGALRQALDRGKLDKTEAAELLSRGHALFHGRAGCASCHPAPLFTDHDFHNIGLGAPDSTPRPEEDRGRFSRVPIGLKEDRLIGAFRTPTLRALSRTPPYFHTGDYQTTRQVVQFYQRPWSNPHLARALRADEDVRVLNLSPDDLDALVAFLTALDGRPVDRRVRDLPAR